MSKQYGTASGVANPGSIISGSTYRFTVLTEQLIRMEYSPNGEFVDEQTQIVLNRQFPVPEFTVKNETDKLEIVTKYLIVTYDKKPFSQNGLTVQMRSNPYLRKTGIWFYGDMEFARMGNLKGTASTLDNAVGDYYYRDSADETKVWGEPDKPIELCDGLLSKNGFTVIDDSKSLLFMPDGWVKPAPADHTDVYFMCCGRDYRGTLDLFFRLSGKTPMLPRWALGNWWSRYYSYTQEEYMELMDRFAEEKLPISVAIQDMGWHYVDIDPKYGKGWTGYTWNKELFPDPAGMMKELHERGMHVSLNVHPADGVRAHEEAYPAMAEELGVDAQQEIPIPFDVTDRKFMDAYFKYLHHPNEEIGVDFWWMDWQQGSNTRVPGYDPLWMLNHYHYLDNGRSGNRAMDFSRFAGLGSHRYPIGFSGSTFITWESLDYQPYFTATASNVGYGWWSHDIGGHRNGYREDELTTRWVQFGVFSPIMRLHSSNEVFTGKEPWKFCADAERTMRRFLSLRHQLVPYTYTMNERCFRENQPLVQPMYYGWPGKEEAYNYKNEYFFGSELIVNPITSRSSAVTRMGSVKTWLPEGIWFDFFTGMRYQGDKTLILHRPLDTIPVLAKAGGVVPMQGLDELSCRTDNPKHMEICAFMGAPGSFTLYEDDGVSMGYEEGAAVHTEMKVLWDRYKGFVICPAQGETDLIPQKRDYTVRLFGVGADALDRVTEGGLAKDAETEYDAVRHVLSVTVKDCDVSKELVVSLRGDAQLCENDLAAAGYEIINRAQTAFLTKERLYKLLCSKKPKESILATMESMYMEEDLKSAIRELLLA